MQGQIRKAMLMLAIAATLLSVPQQGDAQTLERQVGNHRFVGVPGVPNPFVGTFVRSSTGVASTLGLQVEYYTFDDPPELIGIRENDLKFLIQEFEFQQKIGSRWAARLAASGSGRMGTDTATLLSEGISGIVGWNLGGTYQLSEKENFKFAVAADVNSNSLTAIAIGDYIRGVIATGLSDTTNTLVSTRSNLRITSGVRAAWGKNTSFGYALYGDLGAQEPYDPEDDTQFFWQAGGVLSWDMREKWRPDIGFTLATAYRSRSSRNEDLGSGGLNSSFTIAYTGRPDFNVGLQTSYQRLKQLEVDNRVGTLGFNFFLRFDFS